MIDFTVAIPTYNGASHLHRILDALIAQTSLDNVTWEVIVVDNNSTDETASVIAQYQAKWPDTSVLKSFLETQQGAAFARHRAVKESRGELIGFLDDDVMPAPDWVANTYKFGIDHPEVGVFGGQIHGEFEVQPPENFRRIQGFLAIREHGSEPYRFNPAKLSLPVGAAFGVRRQAWLDNVADKPIFTGRVGGSMVCGDDLEPMLLIHKGGWETWYTPTTHAYHHIPRGRLEKHYLISLMYGSALCTCQLRMLNTANWQKAVVILQILLGNSKRLLKHLIAYRKQTKTETVPACELAFLLGNLVSPFYFLKTSALRR